jgi:uncharacterized protein (TIGR00156 family)
MEVDMQILLPALLLWLAAAFPHDALAAAAQNGGAPSFQGGGFSGPGVALSTVQQAVSLRDDAYVLLRGHIIRHLGKDRYLFRDATGEINVDIDPDKWEGRTVTPEDTVEIRGEVDKDWNSVEVDVDRLSIVQ